MHVFCFAIILLIKYFSIYAKPYKETT